MRFVAALYAQVGGQAPTGAMQWQINNNTEVRIVRPRAFLPDPNVQTTRVTENLLYSRVNAQLINPLEWKLGESKKMFEARSNNVEENQGKILYYNIGDGHGFCYCKKCGRLVVEEEAEKSKDGNLSPIPKMMNPFFHADDAASAGDGDDGEAAPVRYHYPVSGPQAGQFARRRNASMACRAKAAEDYLRNVIIGDLIQTDYTEVRIRLKASDNSWLKSCGGDEKTKNLLRTIALALAQALMEYLGKDREDVDVLITPDAHICVFDANPGGAGYSNQLAKLLNEETEVMTRARKLLQSAVDKNARDMLLSRRTRRFARDLAIPEALEWFNAAMEAQH